MSEDGVESLEGEFALGPAKAAELLLNGMRDAIAEEPKKCGRKPSDGFVEDGMSGEGCETRAGCEKVEDRLGVAVV